jgi:hypothetical protein
MAPALELVMAGASNLFESVLFMLDVYLRSW